MNEIPKDTIEIPKDKIEEETIFVGSDIPPVNSLNPNFVANVTIKGLALLYFGENSKRAELGFINADGHPFVMSINGVEIPVAQGSQVNINSKKTGVGKIFHSVNDQDFRNIIDLNTIYGANITLNSAFPFFARVYLNDATFYTLSKSVYTAQLREIGGIGRISLPQIGKVGGAYIYDEDFEIKIEDKNGNVTTVDLTPHTPPYRILLKYQCLTTEDASQDSDFLLINDAIDLSQCPNKTRYSLRYSGPEPADLTEAEAEYIKVRSKEILDLITEVKALDVENTQRIIPPLERIRAFSSCEIACQIVAIGTKTLEV